jgi:hypothetical protein
MSGGRSEETADERRAKYIECRENEMNMWEAAEEVGVGLSTARRYERYYEVWKFGHVLAKPPTARVYGGPYRG